jgi:hypothetical protein
MDEPGGWKHELSRLKGLYAAAAVILAGYELAAIVLT